MNSINTSDAALKSATYDTISKIKTIFPTEIFEEQMSLSTHNMDIHIPKYNITVSFNKPSILLKKNVPLELDSTPRELPMNNLARQCIEACARPVGTVISVEGEDVFTIAGKIYTAIQHINGTWLSMIPKCVFVTLPAELIIHIVLLARKGNYNDLRTLRSFSRLSKTFNTVLRAHRQEIIDHYTIKQLFTGIYAGTTYRFCGKGHRDYGLPANIYDNRANNWYKFGKLHRDNDLPAHVSAPPYNNNTMTVCRWYQHGKQHRDDDKPAEIRKIGYCEELFTQYSRLYDADCSPTFTNDIFNNTYKEWYKNGKLHRDNDLPAIIYIDGTSHWYRLGKRHRAWGKPAVVDGAGIPKEWWINGNHIYH